MLHLTIYRVYMNMTYDICAYSKTLMSVSCISAIYLITYYNYNYYRFTSYAHVLWDFIGVSMDIQVKSRQLASLDW